MARYIDADELLNKLPNDLPYKASVKRVLMQAPDADVVPKSEVENLKIELEGMRTAGNSYKIHYEKAMSEVEVWKQNRFNLFQKLELYRITRQEVAREIFEEIENAIDLNLLIIKNMLNVKGGRAYEKTVLLAKAQAFTDIKNFLAELKKKYTEKQL